MNDFCLVVHYDIYNMAFEIMFDANQLLLKLSMNIIITVIAICNASFMI